MTSSFVKDDKFCYLGWLWWFSHSGNLAKEQVTKCAGKMWLQAFQPKTANLLCQEEFYLLSLPLLFWCGDYRFARHMTYVVCWGLLWGNLLKDVFRLPRPKNVKAEVWVPHSASQIDSTACRDFGFPSTHAMKLGHWDDLILKCLLQVEQTWKYKSRSEKAGLYSGVKNLYLYTCIWPKETSCRYCSDWNMLPVVDIQLRNSISNSLFALLFYLSHPWIDGTAMIAMVFGMCFWISSISLGRLYLGVHSPMDVKGGLLLGFAVAIMAGPLQVCNAFDQFMLQTPYVALWLLVMVVLVLVLNPQPRPMTPTFMQNCTLCGLILGAAVGFRTEMDRRGQPSLHESSLGQIVLRVVLGYSMLLLARIILKRLLSELLGAFGFEANPAKPVSKDKPRSGIKGWDLFAAAFMKTTVYAVMAWTIVCGAPAVFEALKMPCSMNGWEKKSVSCVRGFSELARVRVVLGASMCGMYMTFHGLWVFDVSWLMCQVDLLTFPIALTALAFCTTLTDKTRKRWTNFSQTSIRNHENQRKQKHDFNDSWCSSRNRASFFQLRSSFTSFGLLPRLHHWCRRMVLRFGGSSWVAPPWIGVLQKLNGPLVHPMEEMLYAKTCQHLQVSSFASH